MMQAMNIHQKRGLGPHLQEKRKQELKKKKKYIQKHHFLDGGTRQDPLNLKSMAPQGSAENSPAASPAVNSARTAPDRIVPVTVFKEDPLNLNEQIPDDEYRSRVKQQWVRIEASRKRRSARIRSKRKDGSQCPLDNFYDPESSRPRSLSLGAKPSSNDVVSPVSAQGSPRKRRRTYSDGTSASEQSGDEGTLGTAGHSRRSRRVSGSRHHEEEPCPALPVPAPVRTLPKSAKFQYGNYYRYYGYRNYGHERDRRLSILDEHKTLFKGKDLLDIGCNSGHLTLAIAREYHPKKIVGLDIDKQLIDLARKNIRHFLAEDQKVSTAKYPTSAKLTLGPLVPHHVDTADPAKEGRFPYNVYFAQGNIVLDKDEEVSLQQPEYDAVLALSVTKWIHLNWGDEGIRRTFQRIYRQLRPGGFFLMEPQAMASYKKRKNLTEKIRQNYDNIQLRPEYFTDYLIYEIGFHHCTVLGESENPSKGFNRPLLAFWKPVF